VQVQDDEGEKLDAPGFVGRIETCHVVRKACDVRPARAQRLNGTARGASF